MSTVVLLFAIQLIFIRFLVHSSTITLRKCLKPDEPMYGGYGPVANSYLPGDTIHYFCNPDTYIGGNYLRVCRDSGDWTGDTPVCDKPSGFSKVEQTSTSTEPGDHSALYAADELRHTCSKTSAEPDATWIGHFKTSSQVLRVMLFLPTGEVSYEVLAVREDGAEFSCGGNSRYNIRYEWVFHNCREPNNTRITSIKIKSLSPNRPLELCEVVSHTLTDPTCVDPHRQVDNGILRITRKEAIMRCNAKYSKGKEDRLRCIRTGEWTRPDLYCVETEWEVYTPEN